VATRDIRTSTAITTCDVCGRTLLRGEVAQVYLDGGDRHSVCELCVPRALSEGWVREGTVPPFEGRDGGSDRRRSLFGRLRRRRPAERSAAREPEYLEEQAYPDPVEEAYDEVEPPPAAPSPLRRARERARERIRQPEREVAREPRHVRAVPTSVEQKIAAAIEVFNRSEHQRTVAGVARSLGEPAVAVRPADSRPSTVNVTVSWELCWYRYEIDLSDDVPGVRVDAQGYELSELEPAEQQANAVCDEHGSLSLP
jgi:hypothetical protein